MTKIRLSNKDRLLRAYDHIFSAAINDFGRKLAEVNFGYGLSKIHFVQEALGLKPDATFIGSPDMTVTRNVARFKNGYGYGGKLSWGDNNSDFVILDIKPNACGMLVGGLNKIPPYKDLLEKIEKIRGSVKEIDGIKTEWDFDKSNHFIDVFHIKSLSDTEFPPYGFIIHGGTGEFKKENPFGDGLYYDESEALLKKACVMETPFGTCYYLVGNNAKKYFEHYKFAENFNAKRRELIAKDLFGEFELIANQNHQGLIGINEIVLGTHVFDPNKDELFPFVLRGDLPAYLVKGRKNFTKQIIEDLGFDQRSKRLGVYHRLLNANILPHGGGYNFPEFSRVSAVEEIGGKRFFEVEMTNDRGKEIIEHPRELPFIYRGKEVVVRTMELNMAEFVAKLIPEYVLKV